MMIIRRLHSSVLIVLSGFIQNTKVFHNSLINMDSIPPPEMEQSDGSSALNPRQKTDIAWKHCYEVPQLNGKTKAIKCAYCDQVICGGGINRMKQHLAGVQGNVKHCKKVPEHVRFEIAGSLIEIAQNKRRSSTQLESDDVQEIPNPKDNVGDSNKRKKTKTIGSYMKASSGIDSSQPSIQVKLQSKERWHETDMAFALWMYDACIPINAVNSPFYEAAISRIATMGHGYTGPSYHALRVPLLKEAKIQVQLTIDSLRSKWIQNGCTIMGDGWKDRSDRSLINFLVYCSDGISFIKSVDVSSIESNADNLCNLFAEIVEIVGVQNVVHMISDNASNYKAAGKLLNRKYPTVSWSPCSAHCINLILKDVGDLPIVKNLALLASRVTVFVYNHKWTHAWLRSRPGWTEIISPGDTRFGTTFIALKSLYDHKEYLEAMVINAGFKKFLKLERGRDVKNIVLDSTFWQNCAVVVKIMSPIMRLLRMCDSDEKPSLGYVYEGMWRAIKGIKEIFRNKEHLYSTYTDIINIRWDKMLRKRLHAAAFWLNPAFQYDPDSPCQSPEVMTGLLDCIEKFIPDAPNIMDEIGMFRERKKSFGRALAQKNVKSTRPDEWWRLFGSDAPNLQRLAIKILSQTSSSSGCERNWSVFERIHTKKRNRLEHQRLNDLVFVHYNLRLQKRGKEKKRQYDPIDYECIDKVDFWVVEAEPNGELDYNELEEMLDEDLEDPGRNRGNDDDDFSMFEGGSSNSTDREVHNILRQQRHLLIDEDD